MGRRGKRKVQQRKGNTSAVSDHSPASSPQHPDHGNANASTGLTISAWSPAATLAGSQSHDYSPWDSDSATPYSVEYAHALLLSLDSVSSAMRSLSLSSSHTQESVENNSSGESRSAQGATAAALAASSGPYSSAEGVETVATSGGGITRSRQQLFLALQEFALRRFDQSTIYYTRAIANAPQDRVYVAELFLGRSRPALKLFRFPCAERDATYYLRLTNFPHFATTHTALALLIRACACFYQQKFESVVVDIDVLTSSSTGTGPLAETSRKFLDQLKIYLTTNTNTTSKTITNGKQQSEQWTPQEEWPRSLPNPFKELMRDAISPKQLSNTTSTPTGTPSTGTPSTGTPPTTASLAKAPLHRDLPLLVPTGEAVDNYLYHANYVAREPTQWGARQCEERAMAEKEKGNAAFGHHQYHLALAYYSRAVKLHPYEPVFFSNRALVYLKLNRCQECVTDCTTSLQIRPSIKAYHRRAVAYVGMKQYERAAVQYRKTLEIERRNPSCLNELAKCILRVLEQCEAQLHALPPGATELRQQFEKRLKNAREEHARLMCEVEEVQHLSEERKRSTVAQQQQHQHQHQQQQDGADSPRSSGEYNPDEGESADGGQIGAGSGRESAHEGVVASGQQTDDHHDDHHHDDHHHESAVGTSMHVDPPLDPAEVVARLTTQLRSNPSDTEALLDRAAALVELGQLEKAIADYRRAVRLDPDNRDLQQCLRAAIHLRQQRK